MIGEPIIKIPTLDLRPQPKENQMDPNKTGLQTSEGKMHAVLVTIGSLLALLMPILTGLHETFPNDPWIGFAFTVLGAVVALFAAKHYGEQRTYLKQTALIAAAKTVIAEVTDPK